jgi:Cu(I)/Ag(I) efflux system membrane fusion protein
VETHDHAAKTEIWTCAMHPQIRMHEPGKCPICGMQLIPLRQGGTTIDPGAIQMTKEAVQLANVLTSVVSKQNPVKELRLYGKVQADERLLQSQVSYLPGRIEKLLVNFTGEVVRKGQTLAVIYSPDLMTAQQELIETAATKGTQSALYEATKDKLRQWKLTEKQIATIESSGKVKADFEIYANSSGIVSARRVNTGDFISPGSVLFDVADLSHVWIMFDAYESDLPYLSQGQKVEFTIQALPGVNYSGNITFIDPVLDPVTRVARVRIEIGNPAGKLKPEMFATGIVKADLNEYKDKLVIPSTAVLWTGKRSVVYVKQSKTDDIIFKMREIELGPLLGNSYVVMSGLTDGEEIVTQGAFSVDASAQLEGKPSMMNPESVGLSITHGVTSSHPVSNRAEQQLKVSGNCEQCKERIETAAKSVSGVSSANWSVETKILQVKFDDKKTNLDAIQKAIANIGHDTEKFKASNEVYSKLPECCLYRK